MRRTGPRESTSDNEVTGNAQRHVAIALLVTLMLLTHVHAAEITGNHESCGGYPCVFLNGEITPGDLVRLRSAFDSPARPRRFNVFNQEIYALILNSRGGSLEEAMEIGRWVRKNKISVSMPTNAECFSACVYIIAAGVTKHVHTLQGNKVGIHRPYLTRIPKESVQVAMRKALVDSRAYFAEMNIPEQLADTMFSISPDSMEILSDDKLSLYRLTGLDIVFEEETELRSAALRGMTRQEYMNNKKLFEDEVRKKCFYPILQGEAASECLRTTAKKYGLHESQIKQSR